MKREQGYTLAELLITIGVAIVLLSMAVPAMQTFTLNSKQSGGINQLVSGIHLARNTAITTNSRVTVCASDSGSKCESVGWEKGWIAFVDLDSDQTVDGNESVIRTGSGMDGLVIKSSQFSEFLMYRPNGRVMNAAVTGNTGQFYFCDKRGSSHAKVVILDLSGRPRLGDGGSGGSGCS